MAAPSTNPNIRTVVDFMASQMDGSQVPPRHSVELKALETAIRAIHEHDSTLELRELGLRSLGAVIDRVNAGVSAEKALYNFIRRGGGHD